MKYEMNEASAALEAFFDKCHQVAKEHGFKGPSLFERMRREHGSHRAAELLVESGNVQSGLEWCRENGLLDYSVEAESKRGGPAMATARSNRIVPKPFRFGGLIGGPPRSRHLKTRMG